jgi:hypothetical protein
VKRDGTRPSFLPNPVIRTPEKFVRRLPGFYRVSYTATHLRKCSTPGRDGNGVPGERERFDRGQGRRRSGSMIKPPGSLLHLLSLPPSSSPVLLPLFSFRRFRPFDSSGARDSFRSTASPSNYAAESRYREISPSPSPSPWEIRFVRLDFREIGFSVYIVVGRTAGGSIGSRFGEENLTFARALISDEGNSCTVWTKGSSALFSRP